MKELDINSMKLNKILCPLSFFGLRKINQKSPHKYIGGKKKKYPNKIISTDIILSFNVYTMPFFFIL